MSSEISSTEAGGADRRRVVIGDEVIVDTRRRWEGMKAPVEAIVAIITVPYAGTEQPIEQVPRGIPDKYWEFDMLP